jgi:hypothetical protein
MRFLPKLAGYIFLKWTLSFFYHFASSNHKQSWNEVQGMGILMLFACPLIELAIMFYPFKLVVMGKTWAVMLLLFALIWFEFIKVLFTVNENFGAWMAVNLTLSIGLLWLMYRKQLTLIVASIKKHK